MPPKTISVNRDDLHALVYDEFYSLGQQADAHASLAAVLGDSAADLDRKRRLELGEPAQAKNEIRDDEFQPDPAELDKALKAKA